MKFWFAILAIAALKMAAASPPREVGNFDLSDQNSVVHRYRFPKQKVTAMTVADRRGSEQLEPWIRALYDRYGVGIDIDGVADVSMIPAPLRGAVRQIFRQRLSYPVMLDWGGGVVESFGYERGVANIYVIDRRGGIVKRVTGPANSAGEQELFRAIDHAIADR